MRYQAGRVQALFSANLPWLWQIARSVQLSPAQEPTPGMEKGSAVGRKLQAIGAPCLE